MAESLREQFIKEINTPEHESVFEGDKELKSLKILFSNIHMKLCASIDVQAGRDTLVARNATNKLKGSETNTESNIANLDDLADRMGQIDGALFNYSQKPEKIKFLPPQLIKAFGSMAEELKEVLDMEMLGKAAENALDKMIAVSKKYQNMNKDQNKGTRGK